MCCGACLRPSELYSQCLHGKINEISSLFEQTKAWVCDLQSADVKMFRFCMFTFHSLPTSVVC